MELKRLITIVTSDAAPQSAVGDFAAICRKLAMVHLRRKIAAGHLRPEYFATASLDDLALDCIADLFAQDEHKRMVQLRAYFDGLCTANASEEELLTHVRRLVCGRVNQSLFRLYNEADPILGKILRNVKLAFQSLRNFHTIDRFNETCCAPVSCATLEHLPAFDADQLEHALHSAVSRDANVPTILAQLSRFLLEQSEHSRIVPLMTVALVIRAIYCNRIDAAVEEIRMEDRFVPEETLAVIRTEVARLKQKMGNKYAGRKGVPANVFDAYFCVIEQAMIDELIGDDGNGGLFERLQMQIPELTREQYRTEHKNRLEYLGRLARKRIVEQLRKND